MDTAQISFASKGLEDLQIAHQLDVNPLTGTANISVPLSLTPGRLGFGPSLALQYSSSGRNSVYGVGWSLAGLTSIGLSSKHHPRYDRKDKFVFNGSEDLVPTLQQNGGALEPKIDDRGDFWVHYYRSKYEQAYIRFEKWVHKTTDHVHWRTRDRNNVVSIYGLDTENRSRIADPQDLERIYLWLLEAQYDDNGNAILYEYTPENETGLDVSNPFEWQRMFGGKGFAQRYLKRVLYGNTSPLAPDQPVPVDNNWLFEVVFDYGDHLDDPLPSTSPSQSWPVRLDPYSSYRPAFQVRTYRLCRRILMFHHFTELGAEPTLVGSNQPRRGQRHNSG